LTKFVYLSIIDKWTNFVNSLEAGDTFSTITIRKLFGARIGTALISLSVQLYIEENACVEKENHHEKIGHFNDRDIRNRGTFYFFGNG